MPEKNRFPAVLQPFVKSKRAQSDKDDETWVEGSVNPTFTVFDSGDARATTLVTEPVAFHHNAQACQLPTESRDTRITDPLTASQGAAAALAFHSTGGARGLNAEAGVSPPIKVGGDLGIPSPPAVAVPQQSSAQDVDLYNQQLTGDLHCPLRTAGGHGAPAVQTAMQVRRMTPRECERLQGFPDDWTLIGYRGKPASECPDGPRYKAIGNSMAVPCMAWIGRQINKAIGGKHG